MSTIYYSSQILIKIGLCRQILAKRCNIALFDYSSVALEWLHADRKTSRGRWAGMASLIALLNLFIVRAPNTGGE
jgi:hypothetical protein